MLEYDRIDLTEGIDVNKLLFFFKKKLKCKVKIHQKNVVYASFIIF